jgi:mono/diheme cytochrome c family protein
MLDMPPRMTRVGSCLVALPLLALASACSRQPEPPTSGAVLYQRYCASCHGAEGRGDGPEGKTVPPATDLTKTSPDIPHLMQVIDGRVSVRAHGDSTMPVWGDVFRQLHDDAYTQRKVLLEVKALAEHVASLAAGKK